MTEQPSLGMQWGRRPGSGGVQTREQAPSGTVVNTRVSLWPEVWPAIALQECIDEVESAPPDKQSEVKWNLPCATCEESTRCLNAKRKEIGSLMYDREILTSPRTSESSLFPRALMNPMLNKGLECQRHWMPPFSLEHEWAVVQAWDIAWSEKVGGDWLVCMSAAVHLISGRRTLLDINRWQQKSFGEQKRLIESEHKRFGSDLVVIESDAAQAVWKQEMAEQTNVPVMGHSASDGKSTLELGVPSLLIKFENRKWEFPYKEGAYHHEEVEVFLKELEAFGWVDGRLQGIGEHDDTVMAFWHLNWGIDKLMREGASEMYRGLQPGRQV